MTKKYLLFSLLSLLFLLHSCGDQATDQPDLVVFNAKIWTGNDAMPYANWIAVKGEEICPALGKCWTKQSLRV